MLLTLVQFWFMFRSVSATSQAIFVRKAGQYLPDSEITRRETGSELECSMHCTINIECVSVNYKVSGQDQGLCQLNNNTILKKRAVTHDHFVYLGIADWVSSFTFLCPISISEYLPYSLFILHQTLISTQHLHLPGSAIFYSLRIQ